MIFPKRSIFLWNVPSVLGGDAEGIAHLLKEAGFDGLFVKATEGTVPYSLNWSITYKQWGENLRQDLVDACHAAGLQVYGWGCPYGFYPDREGQAAAAQVERFGLDGFIFDVESTSDARPTADSNGVHTMNAYRQGTDKPAVFCWWALYRSPSSGASWHPLKVARAWVDLVDGVLPMMYWSADSVASADWWLSNSVKQWHDLTDKPILAAGRAYNGDGCTASPEPMFHFAESALSQYGCSGLAWWVLDQAYKRSDLWPALKQINAGQYILPSEPVQPTTLVRMHATVDHLNIRLEPGLLEGSERGGLMMGDEVDVIQGSEYEVDGFHYVPIVLYAAREYLKE